MQALSRLLPRAVALTGVTTLSYAFTSASLSASDDSLHPPKYKWSHSGIFEGYDSASIRRGYYVYKNICAACHSMNLIAYRNLVNVAFTEDEAKALAEEAEVEDGPNDEGEMFTRPGRLSDPFPRPYPNEEAARYANNGALPPDLSVIIKARHEHEDYVFALLNGYREPPEGIHVREGLHYNPYFAGGQIAMAQPLYDESVEYEDGTTPTLSQLAKDVTTFLCWAAEPELNERKKMGIEWIGGLMVMFFTAVYAKRFRWAIYKNRRLEFRDVSH